MVKEGIEKTAVTITIAVIVVVPPAFSPGQMMVCRAADGIAVAVAEIDRACRAGAYRLRPRTIHVYNHRTGSNDRERAPSKDARYFHDPDPADFMKKFKSLNCELKRQRLMHHIS